MVMQLDHGFCRRIPLTLLDASALLLFNNSLNMRFQ